MSGQQPLLPPFPRDDELNSDLSILDSSKSPTSIIGKATRNRTPLPGYPLLSITASDEVEAFLSDNLLTRELDQLHPILWLVGTRKSNHVYPLHRQIVRGREIILAEDPGLHLLWYYDKIYIKPIPKYLLNHAVWQVYLSGQSQESRDLRSAALGFMRTYAWLIQSEHDFEIARAKGLIPSDISGMDGYTDFIYFIDHFRHVPNSEVNLRYRQYGQLRLSRLNIWTKLYLWRMFYYKVDGQYGAYFARFTPPFLFIFGSVSVALSGMCVVLAVDDGFNKVPNHAFAAVSNWFSIVCLAIVAGVLAFFPLAQGAFLLRELVYVTVNWNWNKAHFRG
ncbi:hypothetical protein BO70DRAFT_428881 [Aspergillus heteromorphus CBS 117.55]|uniref:Uncharacterized protein n=1 Tax=Aspergillus heteromorphus CBS 117.55 TaxID=1448321 RepID=A0A317WHE0_9EURO|nr:uncharacterized protein BO70DRAFT_428881 [Aspergillus heteromorphus CBS 117.55]PWY83620.1 hypothetical protein BO70DRAFT_428881 [Aspergillus heteromorphus CBS 117.55]